MRRRWLVALSVAGALLVGCGDDDGESNADSTDTTSTTDESTTSTTDAPATTSTTVGGAEPGGDGLADGKHFGFITALSVNDATVTGEFDLAQLFTGDEAAAAAAEDGAEHLGDFYIRNVNPKLRPIVVDPEASVTDIDYDACCDPVSADIADFAASIDRPTPVWLTVAGGTVTAIEEIYLP